MIDPTVTVSAYLVGGGGNDDLRGGGGNDVLMGAGGNDKLYGRGGKNLLIGGAGADLIVGGAFEDLLIAGTTAHDANETALFNIMSEWTSTRDFATRMLNILGVNNSKFALRANGTTYFKPSGTGKSVFDDSAKDVMQGNGGPNWYLARLDPAGSPLIDQLVGLLITDKKSKIV
jgi:Ca2+-binding RTX toxin-like protein